MPGYSGYHAKKQRGWNPTTTAIVVVIHVLLIWGMYRLSETEYFQDLIKVAKLLTIQEPPHPPEAPPPPEQKPEPESKPEPQPEPPPLVKEEPPEVMPKAPEEPPPTPSTAGEATDFKPVEAATFVIGK